MLQPLGNRVLVEPSASEEKSAGGIILPDSAQKRPQEGQVLAVGPGKLLDDGTRAPMPVAVGDLIIYPEYGGTEIRVGDKDLLLVDADSILAVKTVDKAAVAPKKTAKKAGKKR